MESTDRAFNEMQTVKRHFFALRNGIITDTLRRAGSPFKIIFGLNLPQIDSIAAQTPHSASLAQRLWDNTTTRESMLLAPMIYPRPEFDLGKARQWCATVPVEEVADILCHKLLRHMPYAPDLADELCSSDLEMDRYIGLRLFFNLVYQHPSRALDAARKAILDPSPVTDRIAASLADEAAFVLE